VESRRNDCTIHTCDSSLPALLIQRIVSRWSLSVRINLFSQRSQRVLAKGVKTAELVRSTLFVAAPSKRSLIQHFYEGGQNPFRTIRRPPPLPPQGRGWVKRTLSDRALTIALESDQGKYCALSRWGVRTKRRSNIPPEGRRDIRHTSNRYDLKLRASVAPLKNSIPSHARGHRGNEERRRDEPDNVFSYAQLLSSYLFVVPSSRIRCSPIPSLFDCATMTRLWTMENWNIQERYMWSLKWERDANNSDIPLVDYEWWSWSEVGHES